MPIPAAPHAPAPPARSPIRCALIALTFTAAVLAAAACGSSKAGTSRDSNAVEKPDLTVAVVPAISAAGLYIAQQRGYFTTAGLRVKIVPVASGIDAIPNLVNGSVDVDEGQWAADLSAEAAGAVRLYALAAASAGGPGVQEVVVPAGSPVTTVAQLRGKTIAVNALGGLAVLLTDNVLAGHGVPVKDVHYVPVPCPAMGAALAADRVDAAFIAEPSLSAAEIAGGAVPLFDVNQGAAQNFPISGYVVTQAWIARYPRTAAFVSALERGQLAGNLAQFLPHPITAITGWGSLLTGGGTLAFSWNLAEDPYWVPVLAAFDTAVPEGMTGFTAMLRRPPFGSVEDVQGLLAAAHCHQITTRVHTLTLTYRTREQWWAAAGSQGPWAACWRHITPSRLETAQQEAFALLDQLREPDGSNPRTMLFACTTGRKETP